MKKLDELKFLLTSVFVINQTNRHKDGDISLILDYAFRRLYGANTNAFPIGACYNQDQFAEMMQKWGLTVNDTDKIVSIGGGCYLRKCDVQAFLDMSARFKQEIADAIAADKTGE